MNQYFTQRSRCPVCEGVSSTTLYRASYTDPPISDYLAAFYAGKGKGVEFEYLRGAEFILEECANCGTIYQREVPGPDLMRKLYEEWLDPPTVRKHIINRQRTADYYLWCAAETAHVINHLSCLPCEVKFLDVGMGWGNWCLIAEGFGCDVYGLELSRVEVEHGTAAGIKALRWHELPRQTFDFINAEQVFEHLPNPLEALTMLRAALRPGGIIRINVPGGRRVKRNLRDPNWLSPDGALDSLNDVAPLQHINCYNFEALVLMGSKAGLGEVELPGQLLAPTRIADQLKALLRPYFNALFPAHHQTRRRLVNRIFFKHS